MNFRPISLLQTGYKVFTKVMATRAQLVMGTPIGDSWQGFMHGRQPHENSDDDVSGSCDGGIGTRGMSRAVLLLDFKKAYDTVARDFLFLVLRSFGFSLEFVRLIQKLHEGTTARFLVNGELSESQVSHICD